MYVRMYIHTCVCMHHLFFTYLHLYIRVHLRQRAAINLRSQESCIRNGEIETTPEGLKREMAVDFRLLSLQPAPAPRA